MVQRRMEPGQRCGRVSERGWTELRVIFTYAMVCPRILSFGGGRVEGCLYDLAFLRTMESLSLVRKMQIILRNIFSLNIGKRKET